MVQVTAHSGSDGTPDNSLEFVRYALTTGVESLEVDVRRNEEGVLILTHDAPEQGKEDPTLAQAFELIQNHSIHVNCDLKEPGLEEAVIDLAKEHDLLQRLIFSGTVDLRIHERNLFPENTVEVFINIEELLPGLYDRLKSDSIPEDMTEKLVAQAAALCRKHGFGVINVHYKMCTPAFMEGMMREGIRVSAWTVNDLETAKTIAAYPSAFNITTRSPALLRSGL